MFIQGYTRYFISWRETTPDYWVTTLEGVAVGLLSDKPGNWSEAYALDGTVLIPPNYILVWNPNIQQEQLRVMPYVPPFRLNALRVGDYIDDVTNLSQLKAIVKVLSEVLQYSTWDDGFQGNAANNQTAVLRDNLIAMKAAQDLENNPTP